MKKNIPYAFLLILAFLSCKKEKEAESNPFDDPSLQPPVVTTNPYNPNSASFEYLYHNIFKPTCANSNCHDGAFEPDFRTITSSYNTLVYAPAISNPNINVFTYRVLPGNAAASVIYSRLTQAPAVGIGTFGQGRMPLTDTNFKFTRANYVQAIKDWINAGAKDIFGNTPAPGNKNPQTQGFQVCDAGSSTKKARGAYLEISKTNGPVDMWFSVADDVTPIQNLELAEVKISKKRYDFSAATTLSLTYVANGQNWVDVTNTTNVDYKYKLANFNLNTLQADTGFLFVRSYFKDPDHATPAETPNNGSKYLINHFVIKILE